MKLTFVKKLLFYQLVMLGAILFVIGCTGAEVEPEAETAVPATAVPVATNTVASSTDPTATAPGVEETDPTATAPGVEEEEGSALAPLLTAPRILPQGWFAEEPIFVFRTFTADEVANDFMSPPGTVQLYNAETQELCQIASGDDAVVDVPCADELATEAMALGQSEAGLSPDGRFQVETLLDGDNAVTTLKDAASGEALNTVSWQVAARLGDVGSGGMWVTNELFLIRETVSQGPLLLAVDGTVTAVAPDLFGVTLCQSPPCDPAFVAQGAAEADTENYHIVLFNVGTESAFSPVQLYHAEDGSVEMLENWQQQSGFSPDGRTLLLYNGDSNELGVRAVDPVDSTVAVLPSTNVHPLPVTWSPDSTLFAPNTETDIMLYNAPEGMLVITWGTDGQPTSPGPWSADGNYLAVRGLLTNSGQEESLFIVQAP